MGCSFSTAPPSEISLKGVLPDYCAAKKLKPQNQSRYNSILRTHFEAWYSAPIESLNSPAFQQHCQLFVQTKRPAFVVVGRGAIATMIKYVNATHGLEIINPFAKLAAADLIPSTPSPRQRKLQKQDLPRWHAAAQSLGEIQRDYLYLLLYTRLRRNEASMMKHSQVRWDDGTIFIPDTENGRPHTLPITNRMRPILERRCVGLEPDTRLFAGLAADHVATMAVRGRCAQVHASRSEQTSSQRGRRNRPQSRDVAPDTESHAQARQHAVSALRADRHAGVRTGFGALAGDVDLFFKNRALMG